MKAAILLLLAGTFAEFLEEFQGAKPIDRPEVLAGVADRVGEWSSGDRRELGVLLLRILRDPERKMLHPGCLAPLVATGSESGVGAVLRIAYGRDPTPLRAVARAAVTATSGRESTQALSRFLSRERSPRARAILALLLGERGDRAAGERLILLLSDPAPSVRSAAAEALTRIYRTCRGYDPAAWKTVVEAPPPVPAEPPPPPEPGGTQAAPAEVPSPDGAAAELIPEFFGIPLDGTSVTVVLDFSRSMKGPGGDRIRAALFRSLALLPTMRRFTVLAFDERLLTLFAEPEPADPDRKERLRAFLEDLPSGKRTEMILPLRAGIAIAAEKGGEAPRLIVISDGGQNLEGPSLEELLGRVRMFAEAGGVIHAAVPGGRAVGLLRHLVSRTGGRYASLPDAR